MRSFDTMALEFSSFTAAPIAEGLRGFHSVVELDAFFGLNDARRKTLLFENVSRASIQWQ
jgi:hypothetical protein